MRILGKDFGKSKKADINIIHIVQAVVIDEDSILLVNKGSQNIWECLGGMQRANETEEEALIRIIEEEIHCTAAIVRKLKGFDDDPIANNSKTIIDIFLVRLNGVIMLDNPERMQCEYIDKNYKEEGMQLAPGIEKRIIPYLLENGFLKW